MYNLNIQIDSFNYIANRDKGGKISVRSERRRSEITYEIDGPETDIGSTRHSHGGIAPPRGPKSPISTIRIIFRIRHESWIETVILNVQFDRDQGIRVITGGEAISFANIEKLQEYLKSKTLDADAIIAIEFDGDPGQYIANRSIREIIQWLRAQPPCAQAEFRIPIDPIQGDADAIEAEIIERDVRRNADLTDLGWADLRFA